MLDLLTRVYEVLSNDSILATLLGPNGQIGANLRKKPDQPAIEYGFDAGSIAPGNKETQSLRVSVYGTTSVEDVLKIADRVTALLTPSNLSDATRYLHCGLCQKNRDALLPTSDFGHQIDQTFRVLYTNLRPPTP